MFWRFKHAVKFIGNKACLPPPLGLLSAAVLMSPVWTEVVFIRGMIAQPESALELIACCRAAGKTIAAGGPLPTLAHEQFFEVDHCL